MFELSHSPYFGYILFAIVFTMSVIIVMTLQVKREFRRVQKELAR